MSSRTQAVLIGGAFIGVLSALPVVSMANCCCLWVVGGGMIAVYLLQQGQPHPVETGDGAVVGCLAGVCGAFVYAVVSVPVQIATQPMQRRMTEMLRGNADVPPEVVEMMDQLSTVGPLSIIVGLMFMLLLGVLFSTLGGVLGVVLFRRGQPPLSPGGSPDAPVAPPGA